MDKMSRRREVLRGLSMAGAVALPAWDARAADAPSEPVVIGVMGLGRGFYLAKIFALLPNVDVRYLCDTDDQRVNTCLKAFADLGYQGSQGTAGTRPTCPRQDCFFLQAGNRYAAEFPNLAYAQGPGRRTRKTGDSRLARQVGAICNWHRFFVSRSIPAENGMDCNIIRRATCYVQSYAV